MMGHREYAVIVFLLGTVALVNASNMEFGGELRLRPELRENPDFNKDTNDKNSFVGSRLRITGAASATDDVTIKVTFQDTRNWGEEAGTSAGLTDTGEAVDIHEGYVQFAKFLKSPFDLRAGRQELVFGDQRLLGHFGWSNQGRAFDAFRLLLDQPLFSLDVFTAKRKENNATTAASSSLDRDLSGLYSTIKKIIPKSAVDVYFLQDREGDAISAAKSKKIYTAGVRVAAKTKNFDFTVEAPWQFGDNGTVVGTSSENVKVSAHALAVKSGYTFSGAKEIRLGAEYNFASGDDNASDNKSKTFNNLFPTNHAHYGWMDNQGWRNMEAWSLSISAKPAERYFATVQFWNFELAEEKDGWYNAAGSSAGALRSASAANTKTDVGSEFDLLIRYTASPKVLWEAGYGYFFAGNFIDSRVSNDSGSHWAYLMNTVRF